MSPAESSPTSRSTKTAEIGRAAENLVARWLTEQGGQMLAHRWHCRWGELDLVMLMPDRIIAFVEVKARSRGNWDADGLLAITTAKRDKLMRAAQAFLSEQPDWATLPCRFDVAIVLVQPQSRATPTDAAKLIELGQPVVVRGHALTLQHYILAAFD